MRGSPRHHLFPSHISTLAPLLLYVVLLLFLLVFTSNIILHKFNSGIASDSVKELVVHGGKVASAKLREVECATKECKVLSNCVSSVEADYVDARYNVL